VRGAQDIANEYRQEEQVFTDEKDAHFEKRVRSKEEDAKPENNTPFMQTVTANKRARAKDMDEKVRSRSALVIAVLTVLRRAAS
jgi:hypothetical protein